MYSSRSAPDSLLVYTGSGRSASEEYLGEHQIKRGKGKKKKRRKSPRRGKRRKSPTRTGEGRSKVSNNSAQRVRQGRQRERRVSITAEEFHRTLRGGSPESPHSRLIRRSVSPKRLQGSKKKGGKKNSRRSASPQRFRQQDAGRRHSGMKFSAGGRSPFDSPPPALPNQRSRSKGRSAR